MKTVGVRELKNRLSEYLREVRAGESILVTDRGEVIAEIAAPGSRRAHPALPPGLLALARRGLATLGSGQKTVDLYVPSRTARKGPSSRELLDEVRGER